MHRFKGPMAALLVISGAGVAFAGDADQAAIKEGCLNSTNWSEMACQCLADKAADLEDVQQAFLAATLKGDAAGVVETRTQMSVPQLTQASMFVANAGPACNGG